jgi:predicted nucleic acid-binding protein
LTDATSFAIMERLGILEAFSFDRHFRQFGFSVIGLDP